MRLTIPNRVHSFSQEKQDVITASLDLYKHYLYAGDTVKYARFKDSAEGNYEEKNTLFNKLFVKQSVLNAYLPESAVADKRIFSNPAVRNASFALVSDILDTIIPQTVLSGFNVIADVSTVGMGATKHYKVPNNNIFDVNKVARGIRKTEPQRLYNGDAVLIPEPRMINTLILVDEVTEFNSPLMMLPCSHKHDFPKPKTSSKGTSYAIRYLDENAVTQQVAQNGLVSFQGGPGSVTFMHTNVIHGSTLNLSPWGRRIITLTYNAISNKATHRSNRDPSIVYDDRNCPPLSPLGTDCLVLR
jgi:hypothetical protein